MVEDRVAVIDGRAVARRRPVAVAPVGSNGRAAKCPSENFWNQWNQLCSKEVI
jgi:hypothetical protein